MSTEWRRIGLFVSSTFEDMHAERDYLVKRVLPQLQEWCEARRLHFAAVDLRWGITEAAATRERSVVLKCLQAIDGSRPLFLCLVGQRRGRVSAPEDVAEATTAAGRARCSTCATPGRSPACRRSCAGSTPTTGSTTRTSGSGTPRRRKPRRSSRGAGRSSLASTRLAGTRTQPRRSWRCPSPARSRTRTGSAPGSSGGRPPACR